MGRWGGRELPQAQPRIHSKSWPNSPQPGEQQAQVQRPCSWVLGILAHCILSRYYCYYPSFTWAQRGDVSCPRSCSYSGAKSRFKSRPSDFRDLVPMGRARGRTSPPAFQALKEERRGASWQQGQRGVSGATTGRSKLTFLQSMMSFSLRKRKMPFPCDRATWGGSKCRTVSVQLPVLPCGTLCLGHLSTISVSIFPLGFQLSPEEWPSPAPALGRAREKVLSLAGRRGKRGGETGRFHSQRQTMA